MKEGQRVVGRTTTRGNPKRFKLNVLVGSVFEIDEIGIFGGEYKLSVGHCCA